MAHITALKQAFYAKPKSCYLHCNKDFHLTEIVGNDFKKFAGDRKTEIAQYVGNT